MTDDARSRILHAAGPVFADKGFQGATIRDICQAAGVNLASVNYHFGDKQRLYIETVKRAHHLRAQQVPLPDWPQSAPPETKLRDFIRTLVIRMVGVEEAPWQARLMLREVLHPTAACKELVEEYFRPHFELLVGILAEVLPPETPPFEIHQMAFSVVGQCLFYRVAGDVVALLVRDDELKAHYTTMDLADRIASFSLAAVGLTPPLGKTPSCAFAEGTTRRGSQRTENIG